MASFASVKAVIVMDKEGKRIHAKYYTSDLLGNLQKQRLLEEKLLKKTKESSVGEATLEADVIVLENTVAVFRQSMDVVLFIVGSSNENELILASVLDGLYVSLSMLLRDQLEKRMVLENLEYLFLLVDELVDGGIILETDAKVLASRVLMKGSDGDSTPTAELTIGQAMGVVREQIKRSFQ